MSGLHETLHRGELVWHDITIPCLIPVHEFLSQANIYHVWPPLWLSLKDGFKKMTP
jgi:hypothetical protein